jgi:hypothetical integral membrane protein (TIGR02206 family)
MTQPADPLVEFHAFSPTHAAVLAAFAVATAAACAAGRRWRGTAGLARAERVAGVLMLVLWCCATAYWLLPANYRIDEALPIHMCDLTGLIAPLVLLTRRRPLRALLYFWGIGLSIHGMLTPVLTDGPASARFWLFWLSHSAIIGTAVYDLVAGRYRPDRRDWLLAIGACAAWLLVVLAVNLSLHVNYGYVGNTTPDRPTVIDQLGPWPHRVFIMVGAVLCLFTTMWLPWELVKRFGGRVHPQIAQMDAD